MRFSTLFLDAGGVLVNPNWDRVARAFVRHGVPGDPRALTRTLAAAEPRAKRELDSPERIKTSDDEKRGWLYFHLVLNHAGIARSEATDSALAELRQYHATTNLWESVPKDVLPSLDRFRALGLQLAVVSNANGTVRAKLARLGLADRFDVILDSQEEGVEKPDPRLFAIALERLAARAETTLHVGDLYEVDVVGARAAGLAVWLLDTAGLYATADCPRVSSLGEVASRLEAGAA
jgi:putative hydrolase of the HAD superfamily